MTDELDKIVYWPLKDGTPLQKNKMLFYKYHWIIAYLLHWHLKQQGERSVMQNMAHNCNLEPPRCLGQVVIKYWINILLGQHFSSRPSSRTGNANTGLSVENTRIEGFKDIIQSKARSPLTHNSLTLHLFCLIRPRLKTVCVFDRPLPHTVLLSTPLKAGHLALSSPSSPQCARFFWLIRTEL